MKNKIIRRAHLRGKRTIAFVLLGIILMLVSVVFIHRSYKEGLKPASASQKSVLFTVPKGSSVQEVAASLQESNLIRSARSFEWYFRTNDLREYLQAGTYSLRPSMNVKEIADVLTQGKIATDLVTILPGQRIDQIEQSLIGKYGFSKDSVKSALDPSNYPNHPALVDKPKGASLEGYLYPESFQKTSQTTPDVIIRSSLDQMQKVLTPELRAGIVRQGLTVHQGVILASIIEQEVGNPEDRKTVAQVFLLRLKEGMLLQSDATAAYGAILLGAEPSLTFESAYNTYNHKGLTPTPISNVSRTSLEAVADPSKTKYLYFVAGDDGKTYFSKTLDEHEQLINQHCKTLCNGPN